MTRPTNRAPLVCAPAREATAVAVPVPLPPAVLEVLADRVADVLQAREAVRGGSWDGGWLDVSAAAEHLACKPKRIYDLVSQRRVLSAKDGSRVLFRRWWLDAYVAGWMREEVAAEDERRGGALGALLEAVA